MKLVQARIDGFGRLAGNIEFSDAITVVCGPNEAGKTTLVECVLRLLFGYPEAQPNVARRRFLPWDTGRPYRAALRYCLDDGTQLETIRDFGRDDVPTETVRTDTGRRVSEFSGSRRVSPGQGYLGLSLPAFEAAAVVRASDFAAAVDGKGYELVAERLAALVGSAEANTSAAAAVDRLKRLLTEIGGRPNATNSLLTRANGELAEAQSALAEYNLEYAELADVIRARSAAKAELAAAADRLARLEHAQGCNRLAAVRTQLVRVQAAQAQVSAIRARRASVQTPAARLLAGAPEIEAATADLAFADRAEADAKEQAQSKEADRSRTVAEMEERARALTRLESRAQQAQAEREQLAQQWSHAPLLSLDAVRQLNAQDEHVAQLDAQARRADAAAAIARQRSGPGPGIAFLFVAAAAVLALAGYFTHKALWLELGAGSLGLGVVLAALWAVADLRRRRSVRLRAQAFSGAAALFSTSKAALEARCRSLGCADVAAVAQAHAAQARMATLRSESEALAEDAARVAAHRNALGALLDQLNSFEIRYRQARELTERARQRLASLLDGAGVQPGELDARLERFEAMREASRSAAAADAAIAQAVGDLRECLGGRTEDDLAAEEASLAPQFDDQQGTGADLSAADSIDREIQTTKERLIELNLVVERCNGRLQRFEQRHPQGAAPLEERVAACADRQGKLRRAKAAAELASSTIERVKDDVHGNFVPILSAAVSRAVSTFSAGRYTQAFVDPEDFSVRVRLPETGMHAPSAELSSGTREQLFLALRAATAAALGSGERVPLLLDDALVHSDDDHLRAAVCHLAELAQSGQQIVLFTQREAVVRAARAQPKVSVIALAGPA